MTLTWLAFGRAWLVVCLVSALIAAQSPLVMRVSERSLRSRIKESPPPDYPPSARKQGAQGVAVAQIQVNEMGEVGEVEVLESPHPLIKQTVLAALKKWKFKPASIEGRPVRISGKLTFYFTIEGKHSYVKNPQ